MENEEFRLLSEQKVLQSLKPKRETVFIDKVPGKLLQARNILPGEKGAFVVSNSEPLYTSLLYVSLISIQQATKAAKLKPQENKTTRMPQNELLDLIYQCFREYRYWPFKALKARLRQPEAYLKQTLEMIGHLVKSGDFAMTWELKPEAKESSYANALSYGDAKEEMAPGADYNFDDASDEEATPGMFTDNDEMQFENVP